MAVGCSVGNNSGKGRKSFCLGLCRGFADSNRPLQFKMACKNRLCSRFETILTLARARFDHATEPRGRAGTGIDRISY